MPITTKFGSSKSDSSLIHGFSAYYDPKREEVLLLYDSLAETAAKIEKVLFLEQIIDNSLQGAHEAINCKQDIISDPGGQSWQTMRSDIDQEGDPGVFSEGYRLTCPESQGHFRYAVLLYTGNRYALFLIKKINVNSVGRVAACVGPLFSDRPLIKSWVSYNTFLGIERIYFYHALVANVTITNPWKSGIFATPERQISRTNPMDLFVHDQAWWYTYEAPPLRFYHGQTTALNDCLARNRYLYQYIVVLDVDEFIRISGDLKYDLHELLNQHFLPEYSSMVFARYLYPAACCNDQFKPELADSQPLSVRYVESCRRYLFSDHDHGKSVARPDKVEAISQHVVLKSVPGFDSSIVLDAQIAHIAHIKGNGSWNFPTSCENAREWL